MDNTIKLQLQDRNLEALIRNGAFKFSDGFFLYTSGQIGPYFIQSIDITKNGLDYSNAIEDLSYLILDEIGRENFNVISGGESRDWDFSNPVAVDLMLPHAKLYKDKEPIGADMTGKKVLHIADLNNEGSSVRDSWYPQIKNAGGNISDVVFYVDRLEDGKDVVEKLGLKSHAVVSLDINAWQHLLDYNHVTKEQYASLANRSEIGKDNWARNMLRERTDLLKTYLENSNNRAKALKVITKGYPDMREELIDRLSSLGFDIYSLGILNKL